MDRFLIKICESLVILRRILYHIYLLGMKNLSFLLLGGKFFCSLVRLPMTELVTIMTKKRLRENIWFNIIVIANWGSCEYIHTIALHRSLIRPLTGEHRYAVLYNHNLSHLPPSPSL